MMWADQVGAADVDAPLRVAGRPEWFPMRMLPTTARHCFSVCLYHEPEFARFFPLRHFEQRYLAQIGEIEEAFARRNYHLKIFCDSAMLETALRFEFANIYLVKTPPAFPFCQHVWRYWSVILPSAQRHECHHFRGLDNLVVSDAEADLLDEFATSASDLWHAPYQPTRLRRYMPIRGSCGVAREGIASLSRHLREHPHTEQLGHWDKWHNDEHWLADWFGACRLDMRLFTVLDRRQPAEFGELLNEQIEHGQAMRLVRPAREVTWMR